jgi:LacI family transcriptional regulator
MKAPAGRRGANQRPTLRDVATLAGVSMKTASRVINGETRVNATLALNVRRAAEVLDYRPNLTARNLRRSDGFTHTLGVVLFDVSNAFSSSLQRAIEDVASTRHIVVISSSVDEDPQRERDNALALVARQVDGLLVVPAGDDQSYLAREQRLGLKVVFVDRVPQLLRADAVVGDNRGGAYRAVTHLAKRGHQRIAFLGDRDYIGTLKERQLGYIDAMRDADLTIDPSLVITNLHAADTIAGAVATLMAGDPPTALFTAQNFITIESIRALKRLELDDCVALVGFDDFDTSDLLRPAISVVSQNPKVMGALAAQLLLNRIDGDASPFETHVIDVNLIERGSGELAPREELVRARLRRA